MTVKMTSVSIDGVTYPVTVTYKRVKNMNLRVNGEGNILVSLPYGVPMHIVNSFLEERMDCKCYGQSAEKAGFDSSW